MTLSNLITVIPTFFNADNTIDYHNISKHIESQKDNFVETIVILGTTSETPTLTYDERLDIAKYVYKNYCDDFIIVVGIGGNNTEEMKEEIFELSEYADYIMISQPYYNKPSQEGIYQHYKTLIDVVDIKIIIYNIPSRCGVNIEPETIKRIADYCDKVVAIKEASGNLEQVMTIKQLCPNLMIYSGDDALVLPIMSVGGVGVISVVSNIVPQTMNLIITKFNEGNISEAQLLFYQIKDLIKYCFIESNPVPMKYVLSEINDNIGLAIVRLPLVQLTKESQSKFQYVNFYSGDYFK